MTPEKVDRLRAEMMRFEPMVSGQFDLLDRVRNWRSGVGASTAPNAILRTRGDTGDHRY